MSAEMPTMLTIKETAERSGFPYSTIRKKCLRGEIIHIKCGRVTYVNWEKFLQYCNGELETEGDND